jgi:iron complex transport system ATP-binding protein
MSNNGMDRAHTAMASSSKNDSNKPIAEAETPVSAPALIDFQNISVVRGDKLALNNLSLRISQKEHVAILGPNGCGKSTLIKTITRECYPLYSPDSQITIMGKKRWNVFELRSLLGIVSNDLMEVCGTNTTGRDIVLSGFFSSLGIFSNHHVEPEQLKRADAALADVGALHLADRPVVQMSSGESQRILIARALVHEPRTLLFDEPSHSLDLLMQRELRETMRRLAQSGVGIVLVTHHTADIIPEIERVVLMRDGRVVGDGPKEEMLSEERISALFGFAVRIDHRDGYCYAW